MTTAVKRKRVSIEKTTISPGVSMRDFIKILSAAYVPVHEWSEIQQSCLYDEVVTGKSTLVRIHRTNVRRDIERVAIIVQCGTERLVHKGYGGEYSRVIPLVKGEIRDLVAKHSMDCFGASSLYSCEYIRTTEVLLTDKSPYDGLPTMATLYVYKIVLWQDAYVARGYRHGDEILVWKK